MSKLSTHVLDNYHGKPASGIPVTLSRQGDNGTWQLLKDETTNADGRTDSPLLTGPELTSGRYKLTFTIDAYYRSRGVTVTEPPFLDEISIEVNLKAGESYHVPLLMTPWSYSTYRGS